MFEVHVNRFEQIVELLALKSDRPLRELTANLGLPRDLVRTYLKFLQGVGIVETYLPPGANKMNGWVWRPAWRQVDAPAAPTRKVRRRRPGSVLNNPTGDYK